MKEYSKEGYIECLESLDWSVFNSFEKVYLIQKLKTLLPTKSPSGGH